MKARKHVCQLTIFTPPDWESGDLGTLEALLASDEVLVGWRVVDSGTLEGDDLSRAAYEANDLMADTFLKVD